MKYEMSLFYFIFSFSIFLYEIHGQQTPQTPCPNFFQYVYDGYVWYGSINLPSPGNINPTLILVLTMAEKIENNNVGSVELLMDNKTIIDVRNNGGIYKYKYNFPKSNYNNLPIIRSIKLNRREHCNNPAGKVIGTVSTITLNHILQVSQPGSEKREIPKRPLIIQQSSTRSPEVLPTYQTTLPSVGSSNNNGRLLKCSARAKQIDNNEFPWLVLLYDSTNSFVCGGSLASNKHVVTAAHCAQGPWLRVELGSNPNNKENVIVRYTSNIIKQAEIAILVLTEEVDNLKFPQVCIGSFGSSGEDTKGVVVSFSQAARQKTSVEIVSQENCSSNKQTFNFCVGGSGTCKGVSGGGFYLERNERVYLRGIMTTKAEKGKETCVTAPYADYVDITLYKNWLIQNLK